MITTLKQEKTLFFFAIFALIAILSYNVAAPFTAVIVLSLIFVTIFKPVYKFLLRTLFNQVWLASILTTLIILLSVIVPVVIVASITANQLTAFAAEVSELVEDLNKDNDTGNSVNQKDIFDAEQMKKFIEQTNTQLEKIPALEFRLSKENVKDFLNDNIVPAAQFAGATLVGFLANLPALFTGLIVFIALVGTLLPKQDKLRDFIIKLSPLDKETDRLYLRKLKAMSVSMVRGTFIVATIQGIASGILLWLSGVEYVLFWALLVCFFSIIPVGAGIINIPIAIILIMAGNVPQGIFLLVVGVVVTALIDNGLRPFLVSKDAYIPPVMTLIGVLGGIQVFGLIGLIYGPVIMIILITTIDIYVTQYRQEV